jgi:hypothetical protein
MATVMHHCHPVEAGKAFQNMLKTREMCRKRGVSDFSLAPVFPAHFL